jgi:hypothetical protein
MDVDEIHLTLDREHCWALVDTVMNLRFPTVSFLRVALLHEVKGEVAVT